MHSLQGKLFRELVRWPDNHTTLTPGLFRSSCASLTLITPQWCFSCLIVCSYSCSFCSTSTFCPALSAALHSMNLAVTHAHWFFTTISLPTFSYLSWLALSSCVISGRGLLCLPSVTLVAYPTWSCFITVIVP